MKCPQTGADCVTCEAVCRLSPAPQDQSTYLPYRIAAEISDDNAIIITAGHKVAALFGMFLRDAATRNPHAHTRETAERIISMAKLAEAQSNE